MGIPCSPCENGFCGNCVGDKSQSAGTIQNAKLHCVCAYEGHHNGNTKQNRNKDIFSSQRDTEEVHPRGIEPDSDTDFKDDDT